MKIALTSDLHYGFNNKTGHIHRKFWAKIAPMLAEENVKVLILAGDLASSKLSELRDCLALIREHIQIPIVIVRGNHDFWDAPNKNDPESGFRNWLRINELHKRWFRQFDVHHLEDGPKIVNGVRFVGWDGWYRHPNPPTNDGLYMFKGHDGAEMHHFMCSRAWKKFDEVLAELQASNNFRKTIAVTHHNLYCDNPKYEVYSGHPTFLTELVGYVDVFACGHNHQYLKEFIDLDLRPLLMVNSGSDYNRPRILVFEV